MKIEEQLQAIAIAMGCRYTLKGEPIAYEKVFSPLGLLPAIFRRADQLCSFCLGYGLGVTFERSENAMVGVVALFDDKTPNVLRLLCATDVLYEFMHQAASPDAISLDTLAAE